MNKNVYLFTPHADCVSTILRDINADNSAEFDFRTKDVKRESYEVEIAEKLSSIFTEHEFKVVISDTNISVYAAGSTPFDAILNEYGVFACTIDSFGMKIFYLTECGSKQVVPSYYHQLFHPTH